MFKKVSAVILAVCTMCFCMIMPASAAKELGVVSVKLNSDIAGCYEDNPECFIELKSDNVVYDTSFGGPVSVSDYAGTEYHCDLKAGRTYYVTYRLAAAEGYELPEKLADGDIDVECGKHVSVYSKQITYAKVRNADDTYTEHHGIMIQARVVVDGNAFQRITGFLYDTYIKIRAWSLY